MGGQATKGKATGREVKWGKERGRGDRWQHEVWGQGPREGGRRGVGSRAPESRQADRVAQEEKEVEERSGDPAGKETERERELES